MEMVVEYNGGLEQEYILDNFSLKCIKAFL